MDLAKNVAKAHPLAGKYFLNQTEFQSLTSVRSSKDSTRRKLHQQMERYIVGDSRIPDDFKIHLTKLEKHENQRACASGRFISYTVFSSVAR